MTAGQGPERDQAIAALDAALRAATPRPDPARRAAALRLAQENFARVTDAGRQGSGDALRPMSEGPEPGPWQGVKAMLNMLTTRGGLTATTALVACGVLLLTPAGLDLMSGSRGDGQVMPEPVRQERAEPPVSDERAEPPVSDERAEPPVYDERAEGPADNLAEAPVAALADPLPSPAPLARVAPAAPMSMDSVSVGATAGVVPEAVAPDVSGESYANAPANPVRVVAEDPVSTFSIDVDTASYALVRSSLMGGALPDPEAVRIEEMVNYFPYDLPAPEPGGAPFLPGLTLFQTPWNPDTLLLHVAIQGEMPAVADRPPLNLVFLIDTSGSMAGADRLPLLQRSLRLMLDRLGPEDQVAVVEYAGSAGLVLPPTAAAERAAILAAIDGLGAGGSTNGQGGLEQAYAVAEGMMTEGEIGRILLATDGDFNVGLSGAEAMTRFIAQKRETGVYLSVLGFGRGNLDDALMQALAQNGNGTAAYIDTLAEAQKVLVDQLTGALFPIAGDVKVQVEFNPAVIAEYRLIGYETRALQREDFNNDRVDAGDLGAGHSVTALYELVPVDSPARLTEPLRYGDATPPAGPLDEAGLLRLRWKAPGAGQSALVELPIPVTPDAPGREAAFAAAIAGFGQLLRGSDHLGDWGWDEAIGLAVANRGPDDFGYRAEAVQLMRLAQSLSAD